LVVVSYHSALLEFSLSSSRILWHIGPKLRYLPSPASRLHRYPPGRLLFSTLRASRDLIGPGTHERPLSCCTEGEGTRTSAGIGLCAVSSIPRLILQALKIEACRLTARPNLSHANVAMSVRLLEICVSQGPTSSCNR